MQAINIKIGDLIKFRDAYLDLGIIVGVADYISIYWVGDEKYLIPPNIIKYTLKEFNVQIKHFNWKIFKCKKKINQKLEI